jgi:NTP pyrophosphatase (non-canonical NTP hydrolase)/nucleoside 2-deoxyribosyltransferase
MQNTVRVTVSGSFRRHWDAVTRAIHAFEALGVEVVSPKSTEREREEDEFVYLKGEKGSAEEIERNHLHAIASSDALYVASPDGSVGPSTALEIGYALALNVPIWSTNPLRDVPHRFMVPVLSEREVFDQLKKNETRIAIPLIDRLNYLQEYYVEQSRKRGFDRETPEQVFVLLVEEIGELAKAIRAMIGLSVQSDDSTRKSVKLELADCFIYLLHMANQLDINLYDAFREKERLNAEKKWYRPEVGTKP